MDGSVVGTVILIITGLATYQGLRQSDYFEQYAFDVDAILVDRQWYRLLSSGLLHAGWMHFAFNMFALMSFSLALEFEFGAGRFFLIYLLSLLGGSLLSLYLHRNHGDYRAVGASGAVSGVVFASILLYPDAQINLLFLPFGFRSWIFGLLIILVTLLGIKKQKDNIGHEAHLGGALTGMILTLGFEPALLAERWWLVALLLLPALWFLLLAVRNPAFMLVENYWGESAQWLRQSAPRRKTTERVSQEEIDAILDKIKSEGVQSLTRRERRILEDLAREER